MQDQNAAAQAGSAESGPTYSALDYPPFAVTVDLVIFTIRKGRLNVLLVERGGEPFKGWWALPGGFVGPDEDLHTAALRELAEETSVTNPELHLEQLGTYGTPDRDPRMRVVSVAWLALAARLPQAEGGTDATNAKWAVVEEALGARFAFDHATILGDGLDRARAKLEYSTLATQFCPAAFTISELRSIYQAVWGYEIDPRNFNRKVLASDGFVEQTGERTNRGGGRPAKLFRAGSANEVHPPLRRERT